MSVLTRRTNGRLATYNPQTGVKQIAVLEMAEKHYAKAKDATKLQQAIRLKLEAQAEFVLWWDTQAKKAQGKRTDRELRNRSVTKFDQLRDGSVRRRKDGLLDWYDVGSRRLDRAIPKEEVRRRFERWWADRPVTTTLAAPANDEVPATDIRWG